MSPLRPEDCDPEETLSWADCALIEGAQYIMDLCNVLQMDIICKSNKGNYFKVTVRNKYKAKEPHE